MLEYFIIRTVYTLLMGIVTTINWDQIAVVAAAGRVAEKKKPWSLARMNLCISLGILIIALLPEMVALTALLLRYKSKK